MCWLLAYSARAIFDGMIQARKNKKVLLRILDRTAPIVILFLFDGIERKKKKLYEKALQNLVHKFCNVFVDM